MTWYKNAAGRYGRSGAKGDRGEKIVMEQLKMWGIEASNPQDINSQVHQGLDIIVHGRKANVKNNVRWLKDSILNKSSYIHFVECKKKNGSEGWIHNAKYSNQYIIPVNEENKRMWIYKVEAMRERVRVLEHEWEKPMKKTFYGDYGYWVNVDYHMDVISPLEESWVYYESELFKREETMREIYREAQHKTYADVPRGCDCMFGCSRC